MKRSFTIVYFSGSGNTALLAKHLANRLEAPVYSIEEDIPWAEDLAKASAIILMYPIHYSVPPMLFRQFLERHAALFENREIISIVSQMCYSGDGARAVEDFLPESARLIDTHHLNMPNNISNIPFVPVASDAGNRRKVGRALRKLNRIADDIRKGRFKRRHVSRLSVWMGEVQRKGGLKSEKEKRKNVWVTDDCIRCGLCAKVCPTGNFVIEDKAVPQGNCTLCTRCENKCPKNAISVIFNKPVKTKYKGPLKPQKR